MSRQIDLIGESPLFFLMLYCLEYRGDMSLGRMDQYGESSWLMGVHDFHFLDRVALPFFNEKLDNRQYVLTNGLDHPVRQLIRSIGR
ncbi:MAG TPA: hypothetical protein VJ643_04480 [Nitrososphaera sp.]|nr:hypothetical protein [Nitrososphaera sp.]